MIRVTANNGSMMTGPGTNTYLLGGGAANEWAVIDPGPPDDAHFDAVLAAAPGPIRWIFATHTHKDHSPLAMPLKDRTGAMVHGRVADHPEWQDTGFAPDVALEGGERFELPGPNGETTTLRAIRTPGHASNHICYLLEEEKVLFNRRPCDAGVDRRDQPARRRHGGLRRVASGVAERRPRLARAGPRLPDG